MPDSDKTNARDFVATYEALAATLGSEAAPISELRRLAIAEFAAVGFPTPRQEDWRSTSVEPITTARFATLPKSGATSGNGTQPGDTAVEAAVAALTIEGAHRLVVLNGRVAPHLSNLGELPTGVHVSSLATALSDTAGEAVSRVGQYALYEGRPFVALNTALSVDGAFVRLADGVTVEQPIHLLYVGVGNAAPVAVHPRALILAGAGSQATVIETYAGTGSGSYFTNAVTEVALESNAGIDHYKLQQEDPSAFHIGAMDLRLGRDTRFSSHSLSTGGRLVRNDVNADLAGEGIDCTLNGLYLTGGEQHVDNHMLVRHMKPHCNSHEHYRGILDGRSTAVFNGRIYVHHGAQKTDAKQSNRNLLLTDEATANSNPQLEIFADDVRCTHGSTVGQLDEDALFYLRARGIAEDAARSLLIYAFAAEVLQSVSLSPVKRQIENILAERLPRGDVVRQAF